MLGDDDTDLAALVAAPAEVLHTDAVDVVDLRRTGALSAATDTVVLHLWQAVQVVIDLAVSSCVRLGLGSPPTYGDAFRTPAAADVIDTDLAVRVACAAGFRNLVVNAYAEPDLRRLHASASTGPADLRAFLVAPRDHPSTW